MFNLCFHMACSCQLNPSVMFNEAVNEAAASMQASNRLEIKMIELLLKYS